MNDEQFQLIEEESARFFPRDNEAYVGKKSAERERLELDRMKAEIELLKVQATRFDLQRQQWSREVDRENSSAEEAGIYTFYGNIKEESVLQCMLAIDEWKRRRPEQDLTIILNSAGGSTLDGLGLFDFLQELRRSGRKVTVIGNGKVFSMGAVLLQAGDVRVLGRNSFMLIHESSISPDRDTTLRTTEIGESAKYMSKIEDKLLNILTARSTMSKAQIRKKWTMKDWLLDAEEALKLGFIDEIR